MVTKSGAGEKRWLGVTLGSCVVLLGVGLWFGSLEAEPEVVVPGEQLPEPNAYDSYMAAATALDTLLGAARGADSVDEMTERADTSKMSAQQLAQHYAPARKMAWVKKCVPVLKTVRQGLAREYREPPSIPGQPRRLSPGTGLDRLARLLYVESRAYAGNGDWARAASSALDLLEMGHDILNDDDKGYQIMAFGVKALKQITPHLDATTCIASAKRIERLIATRRTLAYALKRYKVVGQTRLQELMRVRGWRWSVGSAGDPYPVTAMPRLLFYSKRQIMDNFTRYMDAAITEAGRPYPIRVVPEYTGDPYSNWQKPDLESYSSHVARSETGVNLAMLQLALRAYRLERGQWPASLDRLVPSYLKQIPLDPYHGTQPPRYRRRGSAYVLYSIGPDGKDDGGKPIERSRSWPVDKGRYTVYSDSTGDFVAGLN